MIFTPKDRSFQDLSFGVKIIFLPHAVPEKNGTECEVETGETSRRAVTGSLLYMEAVVFAEHRGYD